MGARIVLISAHKALLRRDRTVRLRRELSAHELDAPDLVRELLAVVDRHTASALGWRFVMLGPHENRLVVRWINENAKRPRLSGLLWAELICHMRTDTGEIVRNRTQLAELVGCSPKHISDALSELLRMGALIRRQEGRDVRWFINPLVATCLTGAARDDAQRAAPPLLSVVEGGAAE